MVFYPSWTAMPTPATTIKSTTLAATSPPSISLLSNRRVQPHGTSTSELFNQRRDNGDSISSLDDNPSNIGTAFASAITSPVHTIQHCDPENLFCPTGTCYTGVNGYIGCCTVSSCYARTTCIPYHAGQKSCNEDTEGCIFCTDPNEPSCYFFSNWYQTPSQWAVWCTSYTDRYTETNVFYANPYTTGQVLAALPMVYFTLSWPSLTSTTFSSVGSTISSSTLQAPVAANSNNNSAGVDITSGGIVGIAIGSSLALAAILGFIAFLIRSHRRHKTENTIQEHRIHEQYPRGTLGGASLPRRWAADEEKDQEATDGFLAASDHAHGALSKRNETPISSTGQELADTTIAPYSRELESPQTSVFSSAVNTPSGSKPGFQSSFSPYSPRDILRPIAPYTNPAASYSDPGPAASGEPNPPSEVCRGTDGRSRLQNDHPSPARDSASTSLISSNSQTIRHIPPSTFLSSDGQLLPQNLLSGMESPASSSLSPRTPYSQQSPSLQEEFFRPTRSSSRSSPRMAHLPNQSTPPATTVPDRDMFAHAQFSIHRPASSISHSSNASVPPPILISAPSNPALVHQRSSIIAPDRNPPISSNTNLSRETSPASHGLILAREDGLSAHGDWRGWVSPERALSDGLWQREPDGSGLESNEREQSKERK